MILDDALSSVQGRDISAVSCSTQLLERNRWAGGGVPYLKIGRKVLYRKSDVVNFLQQQKIYYSTSDEGQLQLVENA